MLFMVTAVLEVGIGLALLASPALTVTILIGAPFETNADSIIGRIAGSALLTLGVAAWSARNDEHSGAATGLTVSLLFYNIAAAAVLAYAGVGLRLFGIGLWPALVIHVVMAAWCLVSVAPRLQTTAT